MIEIQMLLANMVPWSPSQWKGDQELLCDSSVCKTVAADYDTCCSCHSKGLWEIDKHSKRSSQALHIEYVRFGSNAFVLPPSDFNTSAPANLVHRHGTLRVLPSNICDFQNLKLLDLTSNQLTHINTISCLRNLEILKLEYNKLVYLSNETFQNMSNLRSVSLANNQIKEMDPHAFNGDSINIFNFDLSGNNLTKIDVTNLVMDKLYCEINYENNLFQEIENILGWKVNTSLHYGSGTVTVAKNPPMHFPDYEYVGFSVDQFPKLFKIMRNTNFYFGNNTYYCDCRLEPVLRFSNIWKPDYSFVFPNFPDYICPPDGPNAGINAKLFLDKTERDKLTCDLHGDLNCPSRCDCFDQPSRDRLVVNCTDQEISHPEFLKRMPKGFGHNLELYFKNTGMKRFPFFKYLKRVSILDVSYNSFEDINSLFSVDIAYFEKLKKVIILNHSLSDLPDSFKKLDANFIYLGETPIICDCTNLWIGEWRKVYNVNKTINPLLCNANGKILHVEEVTKEFLGCNENPFQWDWLIILSSVIVSLLAVIFGLFMFFQYEILIMFRMMRQTKKPVTAQNLYYDVYISYDVNELDVRIWVLSDLRNSLLKNGLKVYDTVVDTLPGSNRGEVISIKIAQSKQIIVVLSKAYTMEDDPFCVQEFRGAVNHFFRNKSKSLLLINYDNIQTSDVSDPYMKAFLRLGKYISFADRYEKITNKVYSIVKTRT